jgi:integrase
MLPNSIVWDAEVRGFNARKQFSDVITYSVIYRTNDGTQRWHKLGRHPILTPELARKEAIKTLRAVTLGEDPSATRHEARHSMTIGQLCDEYMKNGVNGKKASTLKSDISRVEKHIKPALRKKKAASITQEDVETFMRSMSVGNQRSVVALLGAMFAYGIKRKLRTDNPAHGVAKPAENNKTRRLSNAEYAALHVALGNINTTAADVISFLAISGWRSLEAKNLKWSEIDIERRVATLGDTKTGQSNRPLSGAAIDILNRRARGASEYVFAKDRGQPLQNVNQIFAKLGLAKDVTPHTLRHSFASLAGDMGLADSTIAGLLGHARSSITSRYIHLDKALIAASDLVAQETLKLMQA